MRVPAQRIRPRRPGLNRVPHVNQRRRDGQSACAHNFGMRNSFALSFKLRRDVAEVFPDRQMLRTGLFALAAAEAEIHSMFLFHIHRSHRNPGISAAVSGKPPPFARHKAALFRAAISPIVSILDGFAVFCNPDSSCSSIRKTYVSFGYRHHLFAGGPPGACSRGNCNAAKKPPEALCPNDASPRCARMICRTISSPRPWRGSSVPLSLIM